MKMGYKGSITFLIISTALLLIPIAGSIVFLVKGFVKTACSKEEIDPKGSEGKKKLKLFFIALGILYGLILECLFFWIIWISKLDVSQPVKILGLFVSLPYLFFLFTIFYALGPAIVFGGSSFNSMFSQIFGKRNQNKK
jgi:hypothetical protein